MCALAMSGNSNMVAAPLATPLSISKNVKLTLSVLEHGGRQGWLAVPVSARLDKDSDNLCAVGFS